MSSHRDTSASDLRPTQEWYLQLNSQQPSSRVSGRLGLNFGEGTAIKVVRVPIIYHKLLYGCTKKRFMEVLRCVPYKYSNFMRRIEAEAKDHPVVYYTVVQRTWKPAKLCATLILSAGIIKFDAIIIRSIPVLGKRKVRKNEW